MKANGSSALPSLVEVLDMEETIILEAETAHKTSRLFAFVKAGSTQCSSFVCSAPNLSYNFYSGHKVSCLAHQTAALKEL